MWLELQTGIGVPLSRQVYEQVKALILRGDLKAEEKLPSSRTLGKDLGIARHTVLEAYEQLLAEGYLEARHGRIGALNSLYGSNYREFSELPLPEPATLGGAALTITPNTFRAGALRPAASGTGRLYRACSRTARNSASAGSCGGSTARSKH